MIDLGHEFDVQMRRKPVPRLQMMQQRLCHWISESIGLNLEIILAAENLLLA